MFKECLCVLFVIGAVAGQGQSGKGSLKNILCNFVPEGGAKESMILVKSNGADRRTVYRESRVGFGSMCGADKFVIAIDSDSNGNSPQIHIMKRDGSQKKQLTTVGESNYWPVASPDGKKIVFISNRDNNQEIYIMNADGSNQKRLTHSPGDDYFPSISKDGSKVVFVSDRDGNPEIYMINADGTGERRITNNPASDWAPMISPDGKKILFTTNRIPDSENFQLYTMDLKGGNRVALTKGKGVCLSPSYSVDGSMIVFIGRATMIDPGTLMKMNANGTGIADITRGIKGNYAKTNGWVH